MDRKIRSKNGPVGYINSLRKNQIKRLCETFEDSKITLCRLYKKILKEKCASINLLWEEILDYIEDDGKDGEEFQRSMNFQFKVKHQVRILEAFIERSFISGSNSNQNSLSSTRSIPVSNLNVRLPKMESKKVSGDPTNRREFI